jgi:hypothetical protein
VEAADSLSASNSHGNLAAFSRCQTQIDADEDDVEQGCIKAGSVPTCVAIALENSKNGKRNPETPYCAPDYALVRSHFLLDARSHFGADVKFQDLQQMAKYPVDGTDAVMSAYDPHSSVRLLRNWIQE